MILSFHPCFTADNQVIFGSRKMNKEDVALINSADVVILPQTCSYDLHEACRQSSAMVFPDYGLRFQYPGKTGQSRFFREYEIPYPKTEIFQNLEAFRSLDRAGAESINRYPHFIKTDKGHEAEGVFLVKNNQDLNKVQNTLNLLEKAGSSGFILQELIPTEGNVLRVVIMGDTLTGYWKRPIKSGQMITSAGDNGIIDKEWRPDLLEQGRVAARVFSKKTGINLAALDYVFDIRADNPKPLILEINYYFGRRGLGGSENYYRLLYETIKKWLAEKGFEPGRVSLV